MKNSIYAALVLLAGPTVPAMAQTIDYATFEQMFGEPVTTSATGKPQRVSEAPAAMEVVTADQIRRFGTDNIPDLLRFVAGVDVRRYGQADAAVGIRGYNTALNPSVLVLLDGRQVYQDDYGLTVWPLIPVAINEIRQIEIIKGPSAALYGFNAVSGVINIVTYDPLRDKINTAFVQGGSQSRSYGEVVASGSIPGKVGVRLSAEGFRATEFGGSEGLATRTQPHTGTVAVNVRAALAPGVDWDLSASLGSLDSDYFTEAGQYEPIGMKANSLRSRVNADTRLGVLQLDVYRNEVRVNDSGIGRSASWRNDVTVVSASDLMKLGTSHSLRVGAEYRDNSVTSLQSFNGRLGYTILAGSVIWDWQLLPNLSLTNAVRIDRLSLSHSGAQFYVPGVGGIYRDRTITQPSFNSGIVYKLSDYDTVRLSVARAIQLPSLLDLGIGKDYQVVRIAGNAGLQPSAVMNYELDYDRALPAWNSTLRVSAFAQSANNSIAGPFASGYTFLPTGQILFVAKNFGGSKTVGGEIGIKGSNAAGWRWNASYALAAVQDETIDSVLRASPSSNYRHQTPTHAVVAGIGYSRGPFDVETQARWQSHFQDGALDLATGSIQQITIPNYFTMHARLGYRVTQQVTLSLVAEQLNRSRIVASAGLRTSRSLLAGVRVSF